MKLILRADVENLGNLGDVVTVKPGYGRNFLLPQGLAMVASEANMKAFELERKKLQERMDALRADAQALCAKLEALEVVIPMHVGDNDKLYGSVTSIIIGDALAALGVDVDRRRILMDAPIRTLGDHPVRVRLHASIVATVPVKVVSDHPVVEEEAQPEAEAEASAEDTAASTEAAVGTNTAQALTTPSPATEATATVATATDSQEIPAVGLDLGELGPRPNHPNAVQGLQLILPMKNAENGTISESVTNVALLPNNLTADQLRRINDIINEDPVEIAKAKAAAEAAEAAAKAMQLQALSKQVNLIVRKDSTTLPEQEQAQATNKQATTATATESKATTPASSSPEQTQAANTATTATKAGVMQLTPNASETNGQNSQATDAQPSSPAQTENDSVNADGTDSEEVSLDMMPRRPVVQIGDDDTDTTLELQAEYAISLGNSALEINDQSVQEVTPQK